ncbi:DUF7373 family lipoprotein [Mycobacteroides salmoniphilum]|uniref:DUF7373 family lipoprotein n=1 Tax=Mycobacteroides salmoniphilum TaxID=404941 RepID=UPI000993AD0D|nr:hypothetical protein [Mycobacteroides salmoniphilum]
MRRFCVLVIALALSACGSPPNDGIEIVTNGQTPTAFSPLTPSTKAKPKPTIALPTPTGSIGDIKRRNLFNEAVRLTSSIVSPTLIEPRFDTGSAGARMLYKEGLIDDSPGGSDKLLDSVIRDYGYVTGVSVAREPSGDATTAILQNTVLIFKDEESARAATEVGFRLREERDPDRPTRVQTEEIPGFPEAKAFSRRVGEGQAVFAYTTAFVHKGPVVVRISVGQQSEAESIEIIARYLTPQLAELDGFTPTPVDQLSSLTPPFDPDGSLLKLATDKTEFAPYGAGGVFDAKGALLFEANIQSRADLYRNVGVDRLILGETGDVIRAAGETGAALLLDKTRPEFLSRKGYEPTDAPNTVPSADCLQYVSSPPVDDPLQRCLFMRGRYVTWVEGARSVIGQRAQDRWNRLG